MWYGNNNNNTNFLALISIKAVTSLKLFDLIRLVLFNERYIWNLHFHSREEKEWQSVTLPAYETLPCICNLQSFYQVLSRLSGCSWWKGFTDATICSWMERCHLELGWARKGNPLFPGISFQINDSMISHFGAHGAGLRTECWSNQDRKGYLF